MKIAANAIAYGIGIEINVIEHRKRGRPCTALTGPSTEIGSIRTENLGDFFYPLVATLVAAGRRLLLATAMTLADEVGGTYAFCDTNGLYVPSAKEGSILNEGVRNLAWRQVLGSVVAPFAAINPYDPDLLPGSILQVEAENFDPRTGGLRPVEAFVIASKRYRLRALVDGQMQLIARSEHGLGHLIPPTGDRGEEATREWFNAWWEEIDRWEGDSDPPRPDWFALPLAGRLPVTSRREELAFKRRNRGLEYRGRVRPFNFLMSFHRDRTVRGTGTSLLVAPFESDPAKWMDAKVLDRTTDRSYRIRTGDPHVIQEGLVSVQAYGDYFEEYTYHPEVKLVASDGSPCHPWTRGELRPRHIRVEDIVRIGKESTRLASGQPIRIGLCSITN